MSSIEISFGAKPVSSAAAAEFIFWIAKKRTKKTLANANSHKRRMKVVSWCRNLLMLTY